MKQRPSWEASSHSTNLEVPCFLQNPKFHYCVYKSLPLVSVLSQKYQVHPLPCYFCKILFNIIIPSMSRFSNWFFPSGFLKLCMHFSYLPFLLYAPPISKLHRHTRTLTQTYVSLWWSTSSTDELLSYLFWSSERSACSLRCHFSACSNNCFSNRTVIWVELMSSVSMSARTTLHRLCSNSCTSSLVYVSSSSLKIHEVRQDMERTFNGPQTCKYDNDVSSYVRNTTESSLLFSLVYWWHEIK